VNKKILGIFFLILFLVIGVPFLAVIKNIIMVQMMMNSADTKEEASGPTTKPKPAPPLLNESNLVGTSWIVKHPSIPAPVTITLNAGGQAVATVPPELRALAIQMLGTDHLVGNWQVNGGKLIASINFQGKTHSVECDIYGDKIYFQDKEIKRAQ